MSSTSHYPAAPVAQGIETRTLSVIVDNEPGVLARVIGLFSGRGYNIESLTVSETEHKRHLSRITIVTRGTPMVIEQIKNQLDRLVPVHHVVDMTLAGKLKVKEMISRTYSLDQINEATHALESGQIFGRAILDLA